MKIYSPCPTCPHVLSHSTWSPTRAELARREGDAIKVNCPECNTAHEIDVDEWTAKPSKLALVVATAVFILGTPLLFYYVLGVVANSSNHYTVYIIGGFFSLPVIVYGILLKQDRDRVNAFNRGKFRGRIV
ncbi:hypothetical protein KFE98_19515 [bacterium SCSIO 12741]|nr:hypothetical protein KFE98_19515 [bacterium SCSIO 12741]